LSNSPKSKGTALFARNPLLTAFVVSLERRPMMGTKPMVFPLDTFGHVYVLHNEMDEPVCTGSRETCYRLLELMLVVKRRADEAELKNVVEAEEPLVRAAAATLST
jgi:hypothetical protein